MIRGLLISGAVFAAFYIAYFILALHLADGISLTQIAVAAWISTVAVIFGRTK